LKFTASLCKVLGRVNKVAAITCPLPSETSLFMNLPLEELQSTEGLKNRIECLKPFAERMGFEIALQTNLKTKID
jgi:hypothetical protein